MLLVNKKKILVPLFLPWITNSDKQAILSALKSPQLSDGPRLKEFEHEFAKYVGSRYAIGVSNATAALHLSLLSIGIGRGDEVIIPDITFIATSNAVALTGAKPVCADIESSLNISAESIEDKITKRTRAIIPVHLAGYPCKMKEIVKIAATRNLKLIEDCAHSVGTYYNNRHVGTFGEAGCFSFYVTKNMTSIEGGMIATNSKKIAKIVMTLRSHGLNRTLVERYKNPKPWIYDVIEPGYNYKLDEVRSSLGLSQLKRLKEIISRRRKAANYYSKKLCNIKGIQVVNSTDSKRHVYHLYIIRIKRQFGVSRDEAHRRLAEKGIQTTVHYKPIHKFSYLRKSRRDEYPNSDLAYKECLTLPLFPTITKKQQDYVIHNLLEIQK